MKLVWANTKTFDDAEFVLFGVCDESGSHAYRSGTSFAPDRIRKISNEREAFKRKYRTVAQPQAGILRKRLFDAGNISKRDSARFMEKIASRQKIAVVVGGDHSITVEAIRGICKARNKKIAFAYLDAHPDFICSEKNYYGSVVCDLNVMKCVDLKKSIIIGMREPEEEEFRNIKKYGLATISSVAIVENGMTKTFEKIKNTVGKTPVYLSIDMDVVDPAFAPGVSTPAPGGIASNELIYLLKRMAKELNVIGFDLMEVNPKSDINDSTSHLAAKVIIETISSFKQKHTFK